MSDTASVVLTPVRAAHGRPRSVALRTLRVLGAFAIAAALLWWVLPTLGQTTWTDMTALVAGISPALFGTLTAIWFAGLLVHTLVLTAGLPGLTRRRALTLNLTGSAVSNVLPLGGAAGVATNLRMVRTWGFRGAAFAGFTIITNIWDVLAKMLLPLVAAALLWATDVPESPGFHRVIAITAALLAVMAAVVVSWLASERASALVVALVTRVARHVPRRWRASADGWASALQRAREASRDLVATRWGRLSLGMAGYVALQGVLLWGCLLAVGVRPGMGAVIAGLAVDRLGTLSVVTPGGIGVGEAASLAVLTALGCDPAPTAAGLLLFRFFTYLIEIPVGGIWLGGWLLRWRGRRV